MGMETTVPTNDAVPHVSESSSGIEFPLTAEPTPVQPVEVGTQVGVEALPGVEPAPVQPGAKASKPSRAMMNRHKFRIEALRARYPKLGIFRLILLLLNNWPSVLMMFLSGGHALLRLGSGLPTLGILFCLLAGNYLIHWPSLNLAVGLTAGVMCLIGTWVIVGVIGSLFSLPISESMLTDIERLVQVNRKPSVTASGFCARLGPMLPEECRPYVVQTQQSIESWEKKHSQYVQELHENLILLRKKLSIRRMYLRSECMVRQFMELCMYFIATIFSSALLIQYLSRQGASHFSPAGVMTFGTAFYFSVTTITTTDYGDIVPVSGLARMLSVWHQFVGVAFMTSVIGVAVDLAKEPGGKEATRYLWQDEGNLNRQIMSFVGRLLVEYRQISRPRDEIVKLLQQLQDQMDEWASPRFAERRVAGRGL